MHYWLPGAGASSGRLYWESFNSFRGGDTIDVPSGMSLFPSEIFRPSRRWAERRFTDIRHWNELDAGGHFAAFEVPGRVRRRGPHVLPHRALTRRGRAIRR